MQPKWHIAFCNVTYTEYAGVTYRDYYGSPATMLEAQLAARDYAERTWGVGRFMAPHVDTPSCTFASLLGMPVVVPEADEIPYLDTAHPLVTGPADLDRLASGDPRTTGLMARRYEAWQYYRAQGYAVGLGGHGGAILTTAGEITGGAVFADLADDPAYAQRLLDRIVDAEIALAELDASLCGGEYRGTGYTGDDYSGRLSPAMYRAFAVPCYRRLYADQTARFMHSELLRADHLRIARDELGITEFHGAGCKLLTNAEMHATMGDRFWTQVTPQELLELTPAQLDERVRELAGCGCGWVQLYPGRATPPRNLEAGIEACRRECAGGPAW
ncbi:MAG: hypothetical protein HYU66_09655 [Armatimonadetes bacterium]|nr:hypothetical protein [Armatimonadota bacterium]